MGRHKLNDSHRTEIVRHLACYVGPAEVAELVKEEYGIEVTKQAIEAYDPTKAAGRTLHKKWRELFETTRKHFLKHAEEYVPLANKSVRMREIAASFKALKARGNHVGAVEMLTKIAKEMGNVYTNKREVTGKDGQPIAVQQMSDEALTTEIFQALVGFGISEDDARQAATLNPTRPLDGGKKSTKH